ncbi:hypothetical protein MASR2M117_12780 [Paludibacter sp.]
MKNITKIMLFAVLMAWGTNYSVVSAAEYCQTPITASDGVTTVNLSCQLISAGNYQIKIESETAMANLSAGCYCNINGVGGNQLISLPGYVRSEDGKTITIDIPSSSPTNLYTPLYILMPGEKVFSWPNDITWGTCAAPVEDEEAPTDFTATKGNVTFNSVELLLKATDNTSTIYYTISYGDGPTIKNTTGSSNVQKSYIVTGLAESTEYNFSVVAKDASGNEAANNPIVVNATTATNVNTECEGVSTEAAEGSFTDGYNYKFTTSGTTVTVEFELLDVKDGVVAYAWTYNPNFAETAMTNIGGKKFTKTFTDQTLDATFKVACKFAFAGGMAVTKQYEYTVGENCSEGGGEEDVEAPTAFSASKGTVLSNKVELLLQATDDSGVVFFDITYGGTTKTTSASSGTQKSYTVTDLTPSTAYNFSIVARDAANNASANSPLEVAATTTAGLSVAASAPTQPEAKVLSIFSDTYTSLVGVNFNPNWGQQTTYTAVEVQENNVLKYTNLNYQGIDFGQNIDVSGMTHLHIDAWTEDETSIHAFVISRTEPTEKYVNLTPLNLGEWNSYDIALSAYTDQGMSMSQLFQFKFEGSGGKTIYLDNLYFYDDLNTSSSVQDITNRGVVCYPNPVADKMSIHSKDAISLVTITNLVGQTLKIYAAPQANSQLDVSSLPAGNYMVSIQLQDGSAVVRKITKL